MSVPVLEKNASVEDIVKALDEAGCLVIRELASPETMAQIDSEFEPHFERSPMNKGSFMGQQTKRMARVVVKSPTARQLITHPLLLKVFGEVFRNECYHYVLSWTEANRMYPGQAFQNWHRDDTVYPFRHPCRPVMCNVIWAINDWTPELGASRCIAGSHEWPEERKPTAEDTVDYAAMPAGSAFVFNSSLYHSAGHNSTADGVRKGMIFIYSLGWLRQQENPQLAVPPDIARTLPRELTDLLGYRNHGYIGSYEIQDSHIVLSDEPLPEYFGASDLYNEEFENIKVNLR